MNKWIKVQDEKPSTPCLALDKFKQISIIHGYVAVEKNGKWRVFDSDCFDLAKMDFKTVVLDGQEAQVIVEVTHWMPLPELPND